MRGCAPTLLLNGHGLPDQAGEAFRKFINEMYKKNSLIKGELEIGGRQVDLKNIDMPVLNIYAEQDHLVPPSSSKDLKKYVSSKDVTTRSFPVGHIGMYVSSKSQKDLSPLEEEITGHVREMMEAEDFQKYEEPYLDGLHFILNQPEFSRGVRHSSQIVPPQALSWSKKTSL